jgi:hypothetical protein
MEDEKNPGGRPTLYRPEFEEQVYKLCLLGAIDKDIADFFEVSVATINTWKHEHPKFLESIRNGKRVADTNVAHSLYKRATGAEYTTHQAFKVKRVEYDEKGKKISEAEEVITVPVDCAVPPDTTAASFWLKNRASDIWRDRVEMTRPDDPLSELLAEMRKQHEASKPVEDTEKPDSESEQ